MSGSDPLLAEPNLADCDGHPHDHDGQTGHGHQYQINRGSGHDAGQQCQQTADHAQAKRGHRHSPAIGFGDVVWDHVFVRQGPQHACGGVQPGVRSRKNRGEHNEVHHVAGERQTNGVEHQHEGAFVHTGVLPRNQRSHDHDGTDEEDDETEQGGVARLRDGFLSGSLVSPAVTPISSVPEKAKFTVSMVVNTGIHPLGNIRPSRSSRIAAHGHTLESAARRTPRNRL